LQSAVDDHSRVVLDKVEEDVNSSDYVNASYINVSSLIFMYNNTDLDFTMVNWHSML